MNSKRPLPCRNIQYSKHMSYNRLGTLSLLTALIVLFTGKLYAEKSELLIEEGATPQQEVTKETITIQPAGTASWDELLEREATSVSARLSEQQVIIPFMPVPKLRTVDFSEGQTSIAPQAKSNETTLPSSIDPEPQALSYASGFAALGDSGTTIPPDTMGAVGPSHVVTMLNSQVRIQNKSGGIISTVNLSTFWTSGTGLSGSPFDPIIQYDSGSGRWIATCDAGARSAASAVFFAISDTSDPTGNWTYYSFDADATDTDWADFPGMGVNINWIAITQNMYPVIGGNGTGAKMWVIDKSTALAGGALTITVFGTGFDTAGGYPGFTLKPCLTFGSEPILYVVDCNYSDSVNLVRISKITGTPSTPSWSATSGSSPYLNTGWFYVDNTFNQTQINAAQLGTGIRISTNDTRMQNPVFRNGRIWCTHSGGLPSSGTPDRTAVFWYELDPVLNVPGGDPIVQSGVLDGGAGVHHFFPSIAANSNGDACIGFSRSDATRYAEAVATTRAAGDPAGTMDPITLIKAGEDSYVKDFGGSRIRWGDYSATVVDPEDDLTFWTIQEYAETDVGSTANDDRWGTWWGKFIPFDPNDLDGDGIPNWWELLYFGGETNAVASATCSNNVNTVMEAYISGIDPTQNDAFFVLSNLGNVLEWDSVSGRVYDVWWTSNLVNDFQPLETNIPWTADGFTDSDHSNDVNGFYQLKVELE